MEDREKWEQSLSWGEKARTERTSLSFHNFGKVKVDPFHEILSVLLAFLLFLLVY
jgi:hypothetical protein